jgi:hypothetical protein
VNRRNVLLGLSGAAVLGNAGSHASTQQPLNVWQLLTETEKADVAKGGLSMDVRPALQKALASSRNVRFPAGTYYLGNVAKFERILDIDGRGGPLSIVADGLVELVCKTIDDSIPQVFHVTNADGVTIRGFHFRDIGYDNSATTSRYKGAAAIVLRASSDGAKVLRNVSIDNVHCSNMVHALLCLGNPDNRISGIKVGRIVADTCYYGINCQNNGDNLVVDVLNTKNVKRSYFAYGVSSHNARIHSEDNQNSTGDVNISCNCSSSAKARDTTNLAIRYTCVAPKNKITLININICGEANGKIQDVRLDLDIDSSTSGEILAFKTFTSGASGPVKDNKGSTGNLYDNIEVAGRIKAPRAPTHITIDSQPTRRGRILIGPDIDRSRIAQSVHRYFEVRLRN